MISFSESGLNPDIIKAITEIGFEIPMPVQAEVIPAILNGDEDLVGLAQTGTGKTAAFGLPLLQNLDCKLQKPQALILSPTRELCMQIANDLASYSKYMQGVSIVSVYGGADITKQIQKLQRGVNIIVATPGRLLDLLERGKIVTSSIKILILDEADEMLNMGFKEDLDMILSTIPDGRRTLMFSATMSVEIANIASNYMKSPIEILIGKRNAGAENVSHIYFIAQANDRYLALKRIIDFYPDLYALVFCRTREETKVIAEKLIKDGYSADALHGDLSQAQRDTAMQKFRLRNLQILVATDVAARGLDVNDLTHVINYNLPDDVENYTHRSGRTGRAGKTGICASIIHSREQNKIREIERMLRKKIEPQKIPHGKEICEQQLFHLINSIEHAQYDLSQVASFLPGIYERLSILSKEDLLQRIVGLEFNRLLKYYENAPDLNKSAFSDKNFKNDRNDRDDNSRHRKSGGKYTRFFLNLGAMDGLNPPMLINMTTDLTSNPKIEIGKIKIMPKFSFFECLEQDMNLVLNSFQGVEFKSRKVILDIASDAENNEKPYNTKEKSNKSYREKSGTERNSDKREKKFNKPKRYRD